MIMTDEEKYIRPDSKILIPIGSDLPWYNSLLIPFTSGNKIGFLNRDKKVVVPPKYSAVYGDCPTEDDYIIVSKSHYVLKLDAIYGETLEANEVPLYGVINWKGEELIPAIYYDITLIHEGENKVYRVMDGNGEYKAIYIYHKKRRNKRMDRYCACEFFAGGRMAVIDPFREGLSRVCEKTYIGKQVIESWGIVDNFGHWLWSPSKHCRITPFYDPQQSLINVKEGRFQRQWSFEELKRLWENQQEQRKNREDFEVEHYSLIDDGLDGIADAYWNID